MQVRAISRNNFLIDITTRVLTNSLSAPVIVRLARATLVRVSVIRVPIRCRRLPPVDAMSL